MKRFLLAALLFAGCQPQPCPVDGYFTPVSDAGDLANTAEGLPDGGLYLCLFATCFAPFPDGGGTTYPDMPFLDGGLCAPDAGPTPS